MSNIIVGHGNQPLINNNFMLRVDAIYDLPLKKVSSFQQENEYESIQSGGENDYVYLRRKPTSKPYTFQIEQYVGVDYLDPLPVGKNFMIPLVLYVSRYQNDFDIPKCTFTFTGCTVMSKTYGELNAEQSGLMVVTTTIAYQSVTMLNNLLEDPSAEWQFDKSGKKMEGEGKRHAQFSKTEIRKKTLEEKSRKWPKTKSARTVSDFFR